MMSKRLTILHTNDFHNHLTAEQAQFLRRAKESAGGDTILVDAGDAISAGNVGVRPGGEPILTLMSSAGYDAMTMGNREFHVAESILRHKIANALFPILCANMRFKTSPRETGKSCRLPTSATRTIDLSNGACVGLIGVTVPMVTERMGARHLSSFLFDDPIAVVKSEAARMRPEVDLLIALTHIGIKADEQLALSCPELDLIVSGHTHLVAQPADRPGVPIVQAGWFGHHYGRVEFEVEPDRRPRIVHSEILPLEAPAT